MFIIFGAFLERTGVADFFINISNALVGRFSGGPAKVAVVASAFEGMVSGSSVANTVGSGAVTIPLMKRTGYKPEFAAAAEASASTGGQIMPPIMGAAAFLMAETVGVPYSNITVESDGSFWVSSSLANYAAAHFSSTGAFIEEMPSGLVNNQGTDVKFFTYNGVKYAAASTYLNNSNTAIADGAVSVINMSSNSLVGTPNKG